MSTSPRKPSVPTRIRNEHAEFDWPPPDEELAQCFNLAAPEEEIAQGTVECVGETVDAPGLMPETSAGPLAHEQVPGAELSGIDDSTPPDNTAATYQPPRDRARRGDWVAEIAQLQALIEALTENVEWRIPNATRR